MKILINKCYGGFSFSDEFILEYYKHYGIDNDPLYNNTGRTDPRVIELFKELGSERSSGKFSKLKLVEIPDNIDWEITDYDGKETVSEVHRTWS